MVKSKLEITVMENTINPELDHEEPAHASELLEECLTRMRHLNDQMAEDQVEIERLRAETREIIGRIGKAA
jgi:hypothetical protein